jgi:hypothetical protein
VASISNIARETGVKGNMDENDEQIRIHERITRMESQFERFISDAESEKRTRRVIVEEMRAVAMKLDDRLRHVEKFVYVALGAVAVIEFVSKIL